MTTLPTHRRPLRLDPRGQWWFDVTLATVLLLPALATPAVDAGWVGLAVSIVQLVPLYWRRHHAVAVFAVVAAGSALQAVLLDTPLWSQLAFPVAIVTV